MSEPRRRKITPSSVLLNGNKIKELRVFKGWTRRDLAHQAEISPGAVDNAENGKPVSLSTLTAIAASLRVPQESLLSDSKSESPAIPSKLNVGTVSAHENPLILLHQLKITIKPPKIETEHYKDIVTLVDSMASTLPSGDSIRVVSTCAFDGIVTLEMLPSTSTTLMDRALPEIAEVAEPELVWRTDFLFSTDAPRLEKGLSTLMLAFVESCIWDWVHFKEFLEEENQRLAPEEPLESLITDYGLTEFRARSEALDFLVSKLEAAIWSEPADVAESVFHEAAEAYRRHYNHKQGIVCNYTSAIQDICLLLIRQISAKLKSKPS